MNSKKRRKRWNIHEHSRYRMVVYFKDQEGKGENGKDKASYFYTFDWKSGYSRHLMPEKGLAWCHRKVAEWGDLANYILIYDRNTNTLIEKYFKGQPIELVSKHYKSHHK